MIYFDQALVMIFLATVLLWLYTYRYDANRLKYDLDYHIPKPSKLLYALLAILMLIFYGLAALYVYTLYQHM